MQDSSNLLPAEEHTDASLDSVCPPGLSLVKGEVGLSRHQSSRCPNTGGLLKNTSAERVFRPGLSVQDVDELP